MPGTLEQAFIWSLLRREPFQRKPIDERSGWEESISRLGRTLAGVALTR